MRPALRRNYASSFLQELEVSRFFALDVSNVVPTYQCALIRLDISFFYVSASFWNHDFEGVPLNRLQEKLVCFIKGDGQDLVLAVGSNFDRLLVHGSCQVLEINDFTSLFCC